MTPLMDRLSNSPGFALHRLTPDELKYVHGLITDQYLQRLKALQPDLVEEAQRIGIANYHQLPIRFDHNKSWPKEKRLLDPIHVECFSGMNFFQTIRAQIGTTATISHDELNWRLVRPHQPNDVGPLHADKWFWDGGYGKMPSGYDRFKIWIAICTEPGSNGLKVLADSHRRQWMHHFEMKDGVNKPIFDEPEPEMPLLPLAPGEMVMFHDELLHGGAVNPGRTCRVSIELTVLFDPREAARLVA